MAGEKKLWLKDGKIIVNSQKKLILCDECPCWNPPVTPWSISYFPATLIAYLGVPHISYNEELDEDQIYGLGVTINDETKTYTDVLTDIYTNTSFIDWTYWCNELYPPELPSGSPDLFTLMQNAVTTANADVQSAKFIVDTSGSPTKISIDKLPTEKIITNAVLCSGSTAVDGARWYAKQTAPAFFIAAEDAPVTWKKTEKGWRCFVGDAVDIVIGSTKTTIPLILDEKDYKEQAVVPAVNSSFGRLPEILYSDTCYTEGAFDPETGEMVKGHWPNGAFADDVNYFPNKITELSATISITRISSWREITSFDPEVLRAKCASM